MIVQREPNQNRNFFTHQVQGPQTVRNQPAQIKIVNPSSPANFKIVPQKFDNVVHSP